MSLPCLRSGRWLLALALLTACTTAPEPAPEEPPTVAVGGVDESAMMPLIGYIQLLHRMTPQELARERSVLAAIPQTPATQLRLATILGQPRAAQDLVRALALLDGVLKSNEPAAASLRPLARAMASQFSERLKLQIQIEKLQIQNEKIGLQLKESQRRNIELQDKLDALADIERSLPMRPTTGETLHGSP